MPFSILNLFTIGIGPSPSHTVGPMRAAERFATQARADSEVKEIDDDDSLRVLDWVNLFALAVNEENASISGADVGCQGEIGVACSMAAGALVEFLGGTLEQV